MDANAKEALNVLIAARKLIKPKGAWTQNTYARGRTGRPVSIDSPRAVCFCAEGAVQRTAEAASLGVYKICCEYLDAEVRLGILNFNDDIDRKQSEVVAIFTRAIAKLRAA